MGGSLRQEQNDNETSESGDVVRVSRVSRDCKEGRGRKKKGGGLVCDGKGSLAICLDVEEKTVDGFNYG